MSAEDPVNAAGDASRLLRLEAMLIAQRKLLMRLIEQSGAAAGLHSHFASREPFQGNEEDPGVIPSPEYALEAAIAEEMRRIAQEIEGLAAMPPAPPAAG